MQPYPYPAFLWGARQVPPNFASAASAGYPDASNMPSVSGSTLTYYPNYPSSLASATQSLTPQSGELPLTTPGATIEGIDLTGAYLVRAAGITIRRCRIQFSGEIAGILIDVGFGYSVTIEDCVLDGGVVTAGASAVACAARNAAIDDPP